MSVLRGEGHGGLRGLRGKLSGGITVKCPKCQTSITVTAMTGDVPVRCGKCNYPLVLRSDLMQLIAACKTLKSNSQVGSAESILRSLSDYIPEAGTALGSLANQHPLAISEKERWDRLVSAFSMGDAEAQEWLNLMCRSHPDLYERRQCKSCGAPKYVEKHHPDKTLCIYCQSAD